MVGKRTIVATTFGELLRQLRRRVGMTQGELAAAVGFSVSQISRLEKDDRLPNLVVLAEQFVPALALDDEPRLAQQLLLLAAEARGELLPEDFVSDSPTPTSASKVPSRTISSLPVPAMPLVGRDDDITTIGERLLDAPGRLLTLLGPPGIGKTQLALAVGTKIRHLFADDVHLISLVNVTVAEQLSTMILSGLGQTPSAKKSPDQQLVEWLRRQELMLILDNFEQIVEAATVVATLLTECPGLYILVTSQQPLRLRAERRFPVAPLTSDAAAELFFQRAQAIDPTFPADPTQQRIVVDICGRLDCLPLAIELIVPQVELFSLQQILAQLEDQRLNLLTDGPRDLPPHHRTLRNALHRSYLLLDSMEQQLLRLLGIFAGGCTLASLQGFLTLWSHGGEQSIALPRADDVLPLLQTLVRRSLVHQQTERFTLLTTVRDYALEQLVAMGEFHSFAAIHATYFLELAQKESQERSIDANGIWLDRLADEHDNLRSALQWSIASRSSQALDLVIALAEFWQIRGHDFEARRWIEQVLAIDPTPSRARAAVLCLGATFARHQADYAQAEQYLSESLMIYRRSYDDEPRLTAHLATALRQAGWLAYDLHDIPTSTRHFEESLQLQRQLNDQREIAETLLSLAHIALHRPEYAGRVQTYLVESLDIYRRLNDREGIANILQQQGEVETAAGNYATATMHFREALTIRRAMGAKLHIAWTHALIGEAAWLQQDLVTAATCFDEAYQLFVELGNKDGCAILLHHRGQVARRRGELINAQQWYGESMALSYILQNRHMMARCSAGLAAVALARDDYQRALLLLGAAQQLFDQLPPFLAPADEEEYQGYLRQARRTMTQGESEWRRLWEQGRALTLSELARLAETDGEPDWALMT